MVSQNPMGTNVPPNPPVLDRGFVVEETLVTGVPRFRASYSPYWRPVIAGALFALSLFVFSWYLMLGCHVGVDKDGTIDPGAGAAVWMCVTACVAFLAAGLTSSAISLPRGMGVVKGIGIWALSLPLAAVLYSLAARGGDLLGGLTLPRASVISTATGNNLGMIANYGYFWAVVIALACGFVFSIIGSTAGCAAMKERGDYTSSMPSSGSTMP